MRFNLHPEDFIPAAPDWRNRDTSHSRSLDHREPEKTVESPLGSPTCNFNAESGELVFNFRDRLINLDLIVKGLRDTRHEYGRESVKKIVLLVCSDAMQESGIQLVQLGFDRVLENAPKSALFRWEKKLKGRAA